MQFVTRIPQIGLRPFVDSISYFAGYAPGHDREILLPDAAMYIIVDMEDRPKHLYDTPHATTGIGFRKYWVSGMQAKPITIEAQQQSSLLIIRFKPGGARAFLPVAAEGLAGEVAQLDDVLGAAAASLRDRALGHCDPETLLDSAEAWLMERAAGHPCLHPAVAFMLNKIAAAPNTRLRDLAELTGFSERQVRNLFWHWVGMPPKQCARLIRFQSVLKHLSRAGGAAAQDPWLAEGRLQPPDWADVASAFGYVDQSHLSADFRQFASLTPGEYVAAYRGLENFLPVHLTSTGN